MDCAYSIRKRAGVSLKNFILNELKCLDVCPVNVILTR